MTLPSEPDLAALDLAWATAIHEAMHYGPPTLTCMTKHRKVGRKLRAALAAAVRGAPRRTRPMPHPLPSEPDLAALTALRDEYPGIYYWEDPRWDGPLGEALRATATPCPDVGLREAATRLLFVRWGAVVYPAELAGPDGIVTEPTRDEWRAALASANPTPEPARDHEAEALAGALDATGDELGRWVKKAEIYRLGLADAAARANKAEAQRDQAWRNLDTAHDDIAAVLRASGLGDYARPISTHDVIQGELLPWIEARAAPPPSQADPEEER